MNNDASPNEVVIGYVVELDATVAPIDDAEAEEYGGFSRRQLKRNMLFCIMLDTIWTIGWADYQLALMPLLVFLKASNTLIGTILGAGVAGLLGMFVSPWISRRFAVKKWYLVVVNVPYIGAIGVAGAGIILSHRLGLSDPALLKFVFFMVMAHMLFAGFVALPHQEYIAACIPMNYRGRLSGLSVSLGSVLSIASSAIGGIILYHAVKPMAFGYLFLMTWAICQSGYIFAVFAKERRTPVENSPKPWSKDMLKAAWNDKRFVRFQTAWALGTITWGSIGAFIPAYGFRDLKMIAATSAIMAIISRAIGAAMSAPVGFLVDKLGAKSLFQIWPLGAAVGYAIILLMPNRMGVYICWGWIAAMSSICATAQTVLMYGIPTPENRAGHYTIQFLVTYGVGSAAVICSGWICDRLGYRYAFVLAGAMALIYYPILTWLLRPLSNDSKTYS